MKTQRLTSIGLLAILCVLSFCSREYPPERYLSKEEEFDILEKFVIWLYPPGEFVDEPPVDKEGDPFEIEYYIQRNDSAFFMVEENRSYFKLGSPVCYLGCVRFSSIDTVFDVRYVLEPSQADRDSVTRLFEAIAHINSR